MHKIRTKYIYFLIAIITVAAAIYTYSTYAIFTYESETSNVVSIITPNSINLLASSYEYKKVIVEKNNYTSIDLDVYNSTNSELCYSIWYKIETDDLISGINVFEKNENNLTTSGIIDALSSKRIHIVFTNDNDVDASIRVGLSYESNNEKCALNINDNRLLVNNSVHSYNELSKTLISNPEVKDNPQGYLIYKNNTEEFDIKTNEKILISQEFKYDKEIFTLVEAKEVNYDEIINYISDETNSYYTCLTGNSCKYLYKITDVNENIETTIIDNKEVEIKEVSISKYDTYIGYLSGKSGLRKIDNDYVYFGDNPNNFIYYNCQNELDENTCELWRIIGYYYDKENQEYITKIIKNETLGNYQYGQNNNLWENSDIIKLFTDEYKILNKNTLIKRTFKQENLVDNKFSFLDKEYDNEITIMNLTDYLNASVCENKKISEYNAECLKNNWLNNGINEYTMTANYQKPTIDENEQEIIYNNDTIYQVGDSINEISIKEKSNIRPVIYIKSRTLVVAGDGTIDSPYIIK